MTQARAHQTVAFAAGFTWTVVLSGCSDSRFEQKQSERDSRIARELNDYAAQNAAGLDRMRRTLDQHRALAEQRGEHLTHTSNLIRSHHERDVRRWKEEETLRRERIETILRGKPDKIKDTYAKMVY